MPYIKFEQRKAIDDDIDRLISSIRNFTDIGEPVDGIANYTITRLINGLFVGEGWRYRSMAHAIGCLEAVKLEFYRRLVAGYEDKAIESNGDLNEYFEGGLS